MWEMNNYNLKKFVFLLRRYLEQYGYKSRISLEDFRDVINENKITFEDKKIRTKIKEILSFLQKFVRPTSDYIYWKENVELSFSRNVTGYNMLNRLVNNIDIFRDSMDRADIENLRFSLVDLEYLHFEAIYRIRYGIPELHISSLNEFKKLIKFFRNGDRNKWWFRGQSSKLWELMPTYLRNIDRSTTKVIDFNEVDSTYTKFGLKEKYYEIFGKSSLDYNMMAYMQHSTSFSPMIDFTSDFVIATSFALSNKSSINDFYNTDSAIICFQNSSDSQISNVLTNYKVGLLSDKKWTSDDLSIIYKSFGTLIKPFADVSYSTTRTNDRMKYQKGLFVMYDNFISFPSNPVPVDISSKIIKIVINKTLKEDLYSYLYRDENSFRQYFLMNPYQFFAE